MLTVLLVDQINPLSILHMSCNAMHEQKCTLFEIVGVGVKICGVTSRMACAQKVSIFRIVAAAEFRFAAHIQYVMLNYILTAFKC